ncbi:unnamed protein product [Closterium sp. NIES-65]|nr:unnamed protein product [Closterium sp. NIES-65]
MLPSCRATAPNLRERLGKVVPSHQVIGSVHQYYVDRFGFFPSCQVVVWSGLASPQAAKSWRGQETTLGPPLPCILFMSLPSFHPSFPASPLFPPCFPGLASPQAAKSWRGQGITLAALLVFAVVMDPQPGLEGHVFPNPVDPSSFMAMICYTNGSLTRQGGRMGFYYLDPEIIPPLPGKLVTRWAYVQEGICAGGQMGFYYLDPEIIPPLPGGHMGRWAYGQVGICAGGQMGFYYLDPEIILHCLLGAWAGQLGAWAGQLGAWAGQLGAWAGQLGAWAGQLGAWAGQLGAWAGQLGAWAGQLGAWAGQLGAWAGQLGAWAGQLESFLRRLKNDLGEWAAQLGAWAGQSPFLTVGTHRFSPTEGVSNLFKAERAFKSNPLSLLINILPISSPLCRILTRADSEGADSEGADSEGADNEGADNEGADNEGADNEGADNEGADNGGADNEGADSDRITIRALVEGQLVSMRGHAERIGLQSPPARIIATGGGSANEAILRTMANVFGCPVYTSATTDSASLGAALRAAHGYLCHTQGSFLPFTSLLAQAGASSASATSASATSAGASSASASAEGATSAAAPSAVSLSEAIPAGSPDLHARYGDMVARRMAVEKQLLEEATG